MSTKIYGGFRVANPEAMSLPVLQSLLGEMSARLTEVGRSLTLRHVLRSAIERFDLDCLRKAELISDPEDAGGDPGKDAQDGYITCAILRLLERTARVEQTGRRDTSIDMGCEVVLLPHESGLYGIVFAENRAIEEAFFVSAGIERFAYWNNTDRPDDVSEEDWAARGRLWDTLLPGSGVPAEHGFTRRLSPVCVMPSVEAAVTSWHQNPACVPSFDERVRAHVIRAVEDALIAELPPSPSSNSMAPVARAVRRARDSDEPQIVALRTQFEARIRAALIEDIQPEHLGAPSRRIRPSL